MPINISPKKLRVLGRFLERSGRELSGADIMRETGMPSGSLYPILYDFEERGFLESRWEAEAPQALQRPRRRLYAITALGERAAELAEPRL